MNHPAPRLLLASSSVYRRQLLEKLGLTFDSASPDIDETPLPDETPTALVQRLAEQKAKALATSHPETLIIGSDQVATLEQHILTKPHTHERAVEQLRLSSGRKVQFLTGLCLYNSSTQHSQVILETFNVHFRPLNDGQIERYHYDSAGHLTRIEPAQPPLTPLMGGQSPAAPAADPSIHLRYDLWGRLVQRTHGGLTLAFEYDSAGRLTRLVNENGAQSRFAWDALDRLVQPLVGGIYTSDPDKLSLRATLPRFLDMEAEFGSVINATRNQKQARGPDIDSSGSGARYGLFTTPRDGLSSLINHLADQIAAHPTASVCLNQKIEWVAPSAEGWDVALTGSAQPPTSFGEVILTLPAYRAAALMSDSRQDELKSLLAGIEYASSAIVVTGHALADFEHPLDAFGLVVPLVEQRRILATSFTSRKFPGRAPAEKILLRTFVGGAMQPELLDGDDDEIRQLVNEELKEILGMRQPPEFSEVVRYQRAMPQYHVGHLQRVDRIERLVENTAGLHLAGSAYRGVGIPDSIASGRAAADAALAEDVSA